MPQKILLALRSHQFLASLSIVLLVFPDHVFCVTFFRKYFSRLAMWVVLPANFQKFKNHFAALLAAGIGLPYLLAF